MSALPAPTPAASPAPTPTGARAGAPILEMLAATADAAPAPFAPTLRRELPDGGLYFAPAAGAAPASDAPVRLVSAAALRHNLALLRRRAGEGVAIWPAIKADAYGHSLLLVARTLAALPPAERPDGLCVARVEEAMRLRDAGIDGRLLVLAPVAEALPPAALTAGLEVVVCHRDHLAWLARAAAELGRAWPIGVHLKIDTGMGRIGCAPDDAPALLDLLWRTPGLELRGIMTHFARADEPDDPDAVALTHAQRDRFDAALDAIAAWMLAHRPWWAGELAAGRILRHAANSGALFWHHRTAYDAVRPGLALYGLAPGPRFGDAAALRPALRLAAPILGRDDDPAALAAFRAAVDPTRARRPGPLLRLGGGTAHGISSRLAGAAHVGVAGVALPLVAVGETTSWAQLPTHAAPALRDALAAARVAFLLGDPAEAAPDASFLAAAAGTISYEVTTMLRASLALVP